MSEKLTLWKNGCSVPVSGSEVKEYLHRDFKRVGDVEKLLKRYGCGHVRGFQVADMRSAEAGGFCELRWVYPFNFL